MRPTCLLLIVAAWVLDLATPQLFIVAVLMNGPIALSSLAFDTRFTSRLVWLAVAANVSAGYANGAQAHHWDAIALGDRVIAAFSFLLVGGLSMASQRTSRRAGALEARSERAARERAVRRAVETIRESVNRELIERAMVREAIDALDLDLALLLAFEQGLDEPATFRCLRGGDVEATHVRPSVGLLSFVSRLAESGETAHAGAAGAVGRLVLDELAVSDAIAVPVIEHESVFGVLIFARGARSFEAGFGEGMRYYVDQSGIALAQAALFAQLADRNADLAGANAALLERSDVIRDLVYALSHDLRTPLAAASLTMRQALGGSYGDLPAAFRTILERTVLSNDELQRLAETLVLVSRYEAGEASRRRDVVRLAALARAAVEELQSLWSAKNLSVTVEALEDPHVAADPGEMRRAIVNLLANAIAFTPAGGRVAVRVGASGNGASIAVDDDGYGVPAAQRARLFQRLDADSSRAGAGTGLGLYVVRRIAEAHDGTIRYEPKPGGGSLFTLALPLVPALAAEARA